MYRQNRYRPNIQGLLVLALIIFAGFQGLKMVDSKDWPEVTGKVTGIEVIESSDSTSRRYRRSRTYTPVIKYLYLVNHISYEGSSNLESSYSRDNALERATRSYPKGSHLQVLYNPEHPGFSTLHRWQI